MPTYLKYKNIFFSKFRIKVGSGAGFFFIWAGSGSMEKIVGSPSLSKSMGSLLFTLIKGLQYFVEAFSFFVPHLSVSKFSIFVEICITIGPT